MRTAVLLGLFAATLAEACPPSPRPPAPPDANDGGTGPSAPDASPPVPVDASPPSSAAAACANLAAVGCADGKDPRCVTTLEHVVATRITTVDLVCLSTKKTKAEIRGCGFVSCP